MSTRLKPSPSFVVATVALVLATSTGAYAAVKIAPKNSVVSKSIKNGQVKAADLKTNAVTGKKIKDGSITAADLAKGTIPAGGTIAAGSVGADKLDPGLLSDLNDATTLGGLSASQIVAMVNQGEYVEARQPAAGVNILKKDSEAVDVLSLSLPHAGKWLVTATMPVHCVYDNSGPDNADPDQNTTSGLDSPFFYGKMRLMNGATEVTNVSGTCQVEAGQVFILLPAYTGTTMLQTTRLIETTGAATLTIKGSSAPSNGLGTELIASKQVTANSVGASLTAVVVK